MSLAVSGSSVVMGGSFTRLQTRSAGRLAAVDAATGAVLWRAKPNKQVNDLVVRAGVVYAGGAFTGVNAQPRPYLVAVSASSGALSRVWRPTADGHVLAVATSPVGSSIIVGGAFHLLDGSAVHHLGSVDATTGAVTAWRPAFQPQVVSLAVSSTGVYAGGLGDGGNFSAFNPVTGATIWSGGTDGNVQAIAVDGPTVYVGGHFANYCGASAGSHLCPSPQPREKILAVSAAGGALLPWDPRANSVLGVFALTASGPSVLAGGDFTRIGATDQQGFAIFRR
jgi:outer membrane protein assembly factor BamB